MARIITGLAFTLLFAVAAFVQMNDADGESTFWIAVYAVAALLSLLFTFRLLPRMLAWPVAGAALAAAAALAVQHQRSGDPWNPETQFLAEKVREAGGMALIGVWLFVAGTIRRKKAPSN
jgi:hypothetical protein